MGAFEKLQLIVQPHEKMGLDNPYKSFTVRTGIVECVFRGIVTGDFAEA